MENGSRQNMEGSSADWRNLRFEEIPDFISERDEPWWEGVYDLMDAYSDQYAYRDKATLNRFLDKEKVRGFMDRLPPEAKEIVIFRIVSHVYKNDWFGMGDMVLEKYKLNEEQQRNISKLLAMEAMEHHSDPDGIMNFTFINVVERVLKNYPDIKNDEEVREMAANGFFVELNGLSRAENVDRLEFYVNNFFGEKEIKENPEFVEEIFKRFLWALKSRDLDVALVLRDEFLSREVLADRKGEIELMAREGFKVAFGHNNKETVRLVEEFLPVGFLEEKETRKYLEEVFLESLGKGYIGICVEIVETFGGGLPPELTNKKIWKSEHSKMAKHGLLLDVAEGRHYNLEGFVNTFGLFEKFDEDEEVRVALVEGLKKEIRWFYGGSREKCLVDIFGIDDEIYTSIFTADYLLDLFLGSEKYGDLNRVLEYLEKNPDRKIKVDERELANFFVMLEDRDLPMNNEVLRELGKLAKVVPVALEYLDVPAGNEFPMNATVKDLIEISDGNGLIGNAMIDANMFDIEEVRMISEELGSKVWSILSALKKGDVLDRASEDQRKNLFDWMFVFAEQAREAKINSKSKENVRILNAYYSRYKKSDRHTEADDLFVFFRNKASHFATAVTIMNNPELIDEIGKFVDEMDVAKAYMMGDKELTRKLKGRFPQVWFPQLP